LALQSLRDRDSKHAMGRRGLPGTRRLPLR